jgi:hypothetical protein
MRNVSLLSSPAIVSKLTLRAYVDAELDMCGMTRATRDERALITRRVLREMSEDVEIMLRESEARCEDA